LFLIAIRLLALVIAPVNGVVAAFVSTVRRRTTLSTNRLPGIPLSAERVPHT
jgi:hypothetical protein